MLLQQIPDGAGLAQRGELAGLARRVGDRVITARGASRTSLAAADAALLSIATRYFMLLVESEAPKLGASGGADAARRLLAEVRNIESVIRLGLERNDLDAAQAAERFANFVRHTGVGDIGLVDAARLVARAHARPELDAKCAVGAADVALSRFQHETAERLYHEALAVFRQIGSAAGESHCYRNIGYVCIRQSRFDAAENWFRQAHATSHDHADALGVTKATELLADVAWARTDTAAAIERYREALVGYEHLGDLRGQGNCWLSLAQTSLFLGKVAEARPAIETAIRFHEAAGHRLGVANGWFLLGEMDFTQSNSQGRANFEAALHIFRALGNTKNEANCTLRLAAISLERNELDEAAALSADAGRLFRRFNDLLGEAETWICAGDVARRRGDTVKALEEYRRALAVFDEIGDSFGRGAAHGRMARVSAEPERRDHFDKAAEAWGAINRAELIVELEAELYSRVNPDQV